MGIASNTAIPIHLAALHPTEALELLTHILTQSNSSADLHSGDELCEELGYLPLAVEQVGAYIAESGITPRDYLHLLADYPAEMYREAGEGHDVDRTIARIWRITLDRLANPSLAGEILRVLAWFAPDAIPRARLGSLGTPPAVQGAIRRLAAYSRTPRA
ncbi:hypothetical protein ACFV0C_36285 [Streptomyces sp. NPDC059568]|uniref:hypothetical protein n=1 Tax=Streptomyces sp. NPDC059568 TaxID=3346868 RepID=UPI00369B99F7